MTKSHKKIKFLSKRYASADMDYIDKLSPEEQIWMEKFSREYFEGETDDPIQKKAANQRRYREKQSDAMSRIRSSNSNDPADLQITDSLDPEKILLLKEEIENKDGITH